MSSLLDWGEAQSEAEMSRRSVFLAAIMALASLGVVAQNKSQSASPPQNNSEVAQQTSSQPALSGATAPDAAARNLTSPAANNNSDPRPQNTTQGNLAATANNGQLPQTSTILPLLGLIGLGSLVAGFFSRR